MRMEVSFKILVKEHYEMLFCYTYSLCKDVSLAEDIVQETFLTAYRKIGTFDPSRDFGAWIRGIARHLLRSASRKTRRLRLVDPTSIDMYLEENFSAFRERGRGWNDMVEALKACLQKVGARTRQIIDMYYMEKAGVESIASRLSLTAEAVWKRLSRGRKFLKTCIEKALS